MTVNSEGNGDGLQILAPHYNGNLTEIGTIIVPVDLTTHDYGLLGHMNDWDGVTVIS